MTDIAIRANGGMPLQGFYTHADKRVKDTLEAKRTHFQLGNHPRITHSQQKLSFQSYQNGRNEQYSKQGSALQSNKSNFELGDPRIKTNFYATTYNTNTDARKYMGYQKVQCIENKNFSSNIQHGAPKPQILYSQNTLAYRPVTGGVTMADKDFIKNIKGNHFNFGSSQAIPNLYVSQSMNTFDFKGDAMSIRAKLDQEKKNDLRRSHFNVGGESYNLVTQQKLAYRPLTASVVQLNAEKKAELRKSHWGVGEHPKTRVGSSNPFVTNNMMNYRWVQPVARMN
eukprot:403335352